MNKPEAEEIIKQMKGKFFIIDGGKEKFETGSVHPKNGTILMTTNKQTRKSSLDKFRSHLDGYEEYTPSAVKATPLNGSAQPSQKKVQHQATGVVSGESPDKIFFTNDYTLFKSITGNRTLNNNKIKRIIADIESGLNMLPFCPIIVNRNMDVIDGQHRLFVAEELKTYVYYIFARDLELQEIARVNSNTERWKAKDFLHCYSVQGNQHYIKLGEFIEKHKITTAIGTNLLMGQSIAHGADVQSKKLFEQGDFKIKDIDTAELILSKAVLFEKHPGHKTSPFINAVIKLLKANFEDWERLQQKFAENTDALRQCPSAKLYLVELETIYNHGKSKRVNIY